jgi:LemA protein
MKKGLIFLIILVIFVFLIVKWGVGLYNNFISKEEGVNQAWAQVENVYQRRYDLIPNLVETVRGYAKQEREVLIQVTEARAKVGGMINLGADVLNNPQALEQFQQAQGTLASALQRLMVVVERYPELKSDKNFRELQTQLEGTENRIAVERRRFNEVVQDYNTYARRFPNSIIAGMTGFSQKAYFKMDEAAQRAPAVQF